jgi:hypothetical protein
MITVHMKYSIRFEYSIRKQTEYRPFENHFEFESNPTPTPNTKDERQRREDRQATT